MWSMILNEGVHISQKAEQWLLKTYSTNIGILDIGVDVTSVNPRLDANFTIPCMGIWLYFTSLKTTSIVSFSQTKIFTAKYLLLLQLYYSIFSMFFHYCCISTYCTTNLPVSSQLQSTCSTYSSGHIQFCLTFYFQAKNLLQCSWTSHCPSFSFQVVLLLIYVNNIK